MRRSIAVAAPIVAVMAVMAFVQPNAMAFEPMGSKFERQTRALQRFLYLGENGESVPTDKSGKKKEDLLMTRVTSSTSIQENEIGRNDIDEEDTSLFLSRTQFETISRNLDAILADIAQDLGDVDFTEEEEVVGESDFSRETVRHDQDETPAGHIEEPVELSAQEACGPPDEIMSVAWTRNEDGECVAPQDEALDESREHVNTASGGATRENASPVSTAGASDESEALHRSLLAMRLEIESRDKNRRQAMLKFVFQQSLLQVRLSMEARARQVAETEANAKIEQAMCSKEDEKSILAENSDSQQVATESEALYRALLATRLEREARVRARGTVARAVMLSYMFQRSLLEARLAMEARAREADVAVSEATTDVEETTHFSQEVDVAIEEIEDEITFASMSEESDDMTNDIEADSDFIFPSSMPLSVIGKVEEKVTSTASPADYHQVSATSLASSATPSDLAFPVDAESIDVTPDVETKIADTVVETGPENDTREVVASLESVFSLEDPPTSTKLTPSPLKEAPPVSVIESFKSDSVEEILETNDNVADSGAEDSSDGDEREEEIQSSFKVTPTPPKEAPPASLIESSKSDGFEEVLETNSEVADSGTEDGADCDDREEELHSSFKVTPTPPKEAPPASLIESHAEEDNISLLPKSQTSFSFTLGEEFQMIKKQDDLVIAKNALTHFTKAAVGGGVATLLTLGSIFKAATSPDVASSAKVVSSTVSEATKESDDKSVAGVAKNIGSVVVSIGAVGSAFLRSFELAAVSSDAAEAGTDAAKEFTLLLTSLVALGLKQGDRIQDTLTRNLVEDNAIDKLEPEDLAEALESMTTFGIRQAERALESLGDLKDDVVTATAGIAERMKQNLHSDTNVSTKTLPNQRVPLVDSQVDCINTPIESVNVNGFAFEEKVETSEQDAMTPFKEVSTVDYDSPSADDASHTEGTNEFQGQSVAVPVNGLALEVQAEIEDSTVEYEDLKYSTENMIGNDDATSNCPMTRDDSLPDYEEPYFFATFD